MPETLNPWDELVEPATRTPRSLETRDNTKRKRTWTEPSMLPTPAPSDGWRFKWVRTDNRQKGDNLTMQKRLGEGWEPVEIGEHPEIVSELGLTQQHGRIERGGLILCKMPEEMVQQREDHYRGIAREQESSAEEHYMRDSNELVKKIASNTRRVVFGQNVR